MKDKIAIREWTGKIIGWLETDTDTGNKTIRDFYGKILGTYDKKLDLTRDFYGRMIAKGDQLSMLLNRK